MKNISIEVTAQQLSNINSECSLRSISHSELVREILEHDRYHVLSDSQQARWQPELNCGLAGRHNTTHAFSKDSVKQLGLAILAPFSRESGRKIRSTHRGLVSTITFEDKLTISIEGCPNQDDDGNRIGNGYSGVCLFIGYPDDFQMVEDGLRGPMVFTDRDEAIEDSRKQWLASEKKANFAKRKPLLKR
jgi:hypothetical protein